MGSVSSSSASSGSIHLYMSNFQFFHIELLAFCIRFKILNKGLQILDWFFGPSSLSQFELFSLGSSADATVEFGEGDASLVSENVTEVLLTLLNGFSFHHFGTFESILEATFYILSTCFGVFFGSWVSWIILYHTFIILLVRLIYNQKWSFLFSSFNN